MASNQKQAPGQQKSFNTKAEAIIENDDAGNIITIRPVSRKTKHRQHAMLLALEKTFGNVSQASLLVKIDRNTHYYWLQSKKKDGSPKYPSYIENCDRMEDIKFDFVENKAMQRVNDGSDSMIQFMLRTKFKNRGYDDTPKLPPGMAVTIHEVLVPDEQMTDHINPS